MDKQLIVVLILVLCGNSVFLQEPNLFQLINPFLPSLKAEVNDTEGLNPTEGQFPWIVFIEVLRREDYTRIEASCIGALISVNYVITQARYLSRSANRTYRLSFGATYTTNTSTVVQYSNIAKIHPNYDPSFTYDFNIALIKCPMPLSFSLTISSVSLNRNLTDFYFNEVDFVAILPIGINGTNYSKKYNKVRVLSNVACRYYNPLRTNETCTLGTKSNPLQNPCTLDQGLIAVFENYVWILLGIGNSMTGCTEDVRTFTRIDKFKGYIEDLAGIDPRSNYDTGVNTLN